jgi:hypothetical protein
VPKRKPRRPPRELRLGSKSVLTDAVRFICPFCQAQASAGESTVEGERGTVPYVLHERPPCKKFMDSEPDVYLRAVREFYQGN